MVLTGQALTLDEFLALPEKEPALEYVDGAVSQKVSPKARHAFLQGWLAARLAGAATGPHSGRVFTEARVTFAGQSRVPDLVFYVLARVPRTATGVIADDLLEPPDLAIEIRSPSQNVTAQVRRCIWYVEHGVPVALLVDPDDQTVLAFRPGATPRALRGADRLDLAELLPALDVTAAELFDSLKLPEA
jgi:Uma2 family endonuclease